MTHLISRLQQQNRSNLLCHAIIISVILCLGFWIEIATRPVSKCLYANIFSDEDFEMRLEALDKIEGGSRVLVNFRPLSNGLNSCLAVDV